MPRSRSRGGTKTSAAGDDTIRPAMLMEPEVGCSRPATQRNVVVLPQPEGPSSTMISPAGTAKLMPSIAGMSFAQIADVESYRHRFTPKPRSLAVTIDLVPVGNPGAMQFDVIVELRIP